MTDKDVRTRFEIGTVLQIMEQLKADDIFSLEVREAEYVELVENYLLNFDSVKDRDLPQEFKNISLGRPLSGFHVSADAQKHIKRLVDSFETEKNSVGQKVVRRFQLAGGFGKAAEEAKFRAIPELDTHSPSQSGKQLYRKLQNFYNSKTFKKKNEPVVNISSLMHRTERSTDFMQKLKSASREPTGRDSSLKADKGVKFNPLAKYPKVKPYNFSGKNINSMTCLYAKKERFAVSKEPIGKQSQSIGKSGSRTVNGGGKPAGINAIGMSKLRPAPQFSHDQFEVELSAQIDNIRQIGTVGSKTPIAIPHATYACDKESPEHSKSNFSGMESRIRTEASRLTDTEDRDNKRPYNFTKGKSNYLFTQRPPVQNHQLTISQQDFDKIKLLREKSTELRPESATRHQPETIIKFLTKVDQKSQPSSRILLQPPKRPIINKPFSTTMSYNYKTMAPVNGMKDLLSKMRNSCINERGSKTNLGKFATNVRNSANVKIAPEKKQGGKEKVLGVNDSPFKIGKLMSFKKCDKPDICGNKK